MSVQEMNRRIFAASLAAAATCAMTDPGWITIAHLGTNTMGRTYTEEHMAVLARDIVPGMHVVEWHHDDPPRLDQLYGIVSNARRFGDEYRVKVRWINRPKYKSWLGIHGSIRTPKGAKMDGSQGFVMVEVFHLEPSSAGSSFQRATVI